MDQTQDFLSSPVSFGLPMEVNYEQIAKESRLKVLDLIYLAQTSHIGSNFSCIDILTVLFDKIDLEKDKFVLSKGWAAASLYYFLWRKGKITEEELNSYCQPGSKFVGLAEPVIPEIMIAGGSMGLGLPGAVGLALAKKINGEEGTIYCLMSDGELAIGTTWESALIASHHKLDNLVVIIDKNGFQAMGKMKDILEMQYVYFMSGDMPACFSEWTGLQINGHNYEEIFTSVVYRRIFPTFIIADTIKGKGVSFMEGQNVFHYKAPTKEEYEQAKEELNG